MVRSPGRVRAVCTGLAVVLAGCTGGTARTASPDTAVAAEGGGAVVVTTSVLADVVAGVVGDALTVETVMPPGADPHAFEPSAQQIEALRGADLVVANGAGFEEGLTDVLAAAEEDGVPVFRATDHVELLAFAGAHAEEEGEEHAEEEGEEHADEHAEDPHFFQDPVRMAQVARALGAQLGEVSDALTAGEWTARAEAQAGELEALDAEIDELLSDLPSAERKLLTNHEAFGYFADRYGFEVVGTVVAGGTTLDDPSAADLERLAALIAEEGVPAIFTENTSAPALAEALAAEAGVDVEVVELFSDSLAEPGQEGGTYAGMLRANAERIAEALG